MATGSIKHRSRLRIFWPTPRGSDNGDEMMGAASGRLGGMQADFVGTLGRKAGDVRTALAALETDPKARGPRDDARRRLHAIGTAARLLHFDSACGAIKRAEAI